MFWTTGFNISSKFNNVLLGDPIPTGYHATLEPTTYWNPRKIFFFFFFFPFVLLTFSLYQLKALPKPI